MSSLSIAVVVTGEAQIRDGVLTLRLQVLPALVLLDHTSTLHELAEDLVQLRVVWPQVRYLVLPDDEQDRRSVEAGGADAILVKGIRAATILETIEGLLSDDRQDKLLATGR